MYYCIFACVQVARIPDRPVAGTLGWLVCLAYPLVSGGRSTTAVIALLPLLNPRIRGIRWRLFMFLGCAVMGLGLFYTPVIQERFFYHGSGTLSDVLEGRFLAFGRFEAWPQNLDEALKHPVFGQGTGSTYHFVPLVWTNITLCHNDYLRIFFEQGAVGLTYFLALQGWLFFRLLREVRRTEGIVQQAFAAAMLGQFCFLGLALTDNLLIYNLFYTNIWFATLGAAFGASAAGVASRESALRAASARGPS